MSSNIKAKLLDWKLDFLNATLNKQYKEEYNTIISLHTRYALVILAFFGIVPWLLSAAFSGTDLLHERMFAVMWAITGWCVLWMPLFFYYKDNLKYAGQFSNIMLAGLIILITVINRLTPESYLNDPQSYHISAFLIIAPLVLRSRMKEFFGLSILAIVIQFIITMVDDEYPIHMRIGFTIPNFLNLFLANYCAYFFEKRYKHDFIRRLLMDAESSKLRWAVSRDSALLRNIFPKNISDELELHMTTSRAKAKAKAKNVKKEEQKLKKPVLKVISAMVAGNAKKLTKNPSSGQIVNGYTPTASLLDSTDSPSNSPVITHGARPLSSHSNTPRGTTSADNSRKDLKGIVTKVAPLNVPFDEITPDVNGGEPTNLSAIISAPASTPRAFPVDADFAYPLPTHGILSARSAKPELHNFIGAKSEDGTQVALSHAYTNVAVIFADLVGFTSMSSLISPQQLCTLLNDMFGAFDDIMDFFHLEKIRTVGDAYLCVANMSIPIDNPEEVAVCAALKMINAVRGMKKNLNVRVGVASGPLIAGVTGIMKWNYDIFGKPFAKATELEALAPPNYVAVGRSVYENCKHHPRMFFQPYLTEYRSQYYVVRGTGIDEILPVRSQPVKPTNMTSLHDDSGSGGVKVTMAPVSIQQELQKISLVKLIEAEEQDEEITLEEFQLGAAHKLGYSEDDVMDAESDIKKWHKLRFTRPEFEFDFQEQTVKEVHKYTFYLSIFFAVVCFIYLLVDIAITPSGDAGDVSAGSKAVFCLTAGLFFGYTIFVKYYDLKNVTISNVASWFSIFCLTFCFGFVVYTEPSPAHFTWFFFAFFYIAIFLRLPFIAMILSEVTLIVVTCLLIYFRAKFDLRARYIMLLIFFFVLCAYTQFTLQKGFRKNFLAQKKIKFDLFSQKIVQYRTKLLLQNIIPAELIPKLNMNTASVGIVDHFEQATMMFVNLNNFIDLTFSLDPADTFQIYNDLFTLFDEATIACGLEKIKTINTVYMVASGLPTKAEKHADMAVRLAIEIYKIVHRYRYPSIPNEKFTVRIGIASGPVVAGIIGKTKYSFDCWSDTTNTASRMESNGWDSYLQTTPFTYNLITNKKYFQKRENVTIKGKGSMDTHVLHLAQFVK